MSTGLGRWGVYGGFNKLNFRNMSLECLRNIQAVLFIGKFDIESICMCAYTFTHIHSIGGKNVNMGIKSIQVIEDVFVCEFFQEKGDRKKEKWGIPPLTV